VSWSPSAPRLIEPELVLRTSTAPRPERTS